ncbi:hypothetical protein AB0G32_28250 [Streptomyces sp. NPDC023723]|uniref:hypothetical protein n=1 Tax=Streptomyces sp. NPDC023723 TaxID=3154323 RepID=UPI0033C92997
MGDGERLEAAFTPGARIAVGGGGWTGPETAAAARTARAPVANAWHLRLGRHLRVEHWESLAGLKPARCHNSRGYPVSAVVRSGAGPRAPITTPAEEGRLMTHDRHEPVDSAASAGVFLAAEAALLEARAQLLRDAIDTLDARMREASEKLCLLRMPLPLPAADRVERQDSGSRRGDEYASSQDVRA